VFFSFPPRKPSLHSDTTVHITAMSITPLCNQLRWIFSRMIQNIVFMQISDSAVHVQTCHWHRCDMHSGVKCHCYDLHNGVNDTAVHITAMSITPLCNQLRWIFSRMIQNIVFMQISDSAAHVQTCHWHRCDMHSGVNITAVTYTAVSMMPWASMTPLGLWTSYSIGSGYL
jgi:hypothetical protein